MKQTSIDDFITWAYDQTNAIMPNNYAREILTALDKYVTGKNEILKYISSKRNNSNEYGKLCNLFEDIQSWNVKSIWELKKKSYEQFIEVLKIASDITQGNLIPRPVVAHQAMLHCYIISQLAILKNIQNIKKAKRSN